MNDKIIVHELGQECKKIRVYGIADLHIGDSKTDEKAIRKFVEMVKNDESAYWVSLGDLINNAVKSSVSNVYHEKYEVGMQKEIVADLLLPIANKCLAIVSGNHERRTKKDADVDLTKDIAVLMFGREEAKRIYREHAAIVKISFGKLVSNNKKAAYTFLAQHGKGGGKWVGSAVNNCQQYMMQYEGVDFAMFGHVHQCDLHPYLRVVADTRNNTVAARNAVNVIVPPWQEYGGYAMQNMLNASPKGLYAYVTLDGVRKRMPSAHVEEL